MSRISTAVLFPGAQRVDLAARLDMPSAQAAHAYVLLAHGFSKDSESASLVAQALADAGLATLCLDFTGGGSVGDLIAAARWLEQEHGAPSLLVGHGAAGAAVIAAATQIPSARAVATINASADDIAASLARLRRALLVMHAPADAVVSIDHASAIFLAAKHPKSFVSLDTADHLLTRREDAHYAASVLAAWAARYLPAAAPAQAATGSRDTVVVRETGVGKFQQRITIGPHTLVADEPVDVGGMDSGATPYDLVLAALGACTAMTIRLYADAKGVPLTSVGVDLMHSKVYATDCAECVTKDAKIDRIERVIHLDGELDDAQRAKLLDIANKCPVHRTLRAETWVPTRLG